MATILDYYKYSCLATAAYVDLGLQPRRVVDGAEFASAAASPGQRRLPLPLAGYLFDSGFPDYGPHPTWTVDYYEGNDPTGFAATFFRQGIEGVLAQENAGKWGQVHISNFAHYFAERLIWRAGLPLFGARATRCKAVSI